MSFWNTIGLIITLAMFAAALYYLNKGKHDKFERTQDLLRFENIDDDGVIELPEGIFKAMVEVEPVNMFLKSPDEQRIIWTQFREMINALHIPSTIIVQSRHKDIKAYVSGLRDSSKNLPTEQLQIYGYELAQYLESEIQEKRIKDHRYYIILEVDPNLRKSELEIPNDTIAKIASGFQKKLSYQEAKDLARQELQDNVGVIASYLKNMGLNVYSMDKNAVLEMAYSAFNRDLAPVTGYNSVVYSSGTQTISATLEVMKNEMDKQAS